MLIPLSAETLEAGETDDMEETTDITAISMAELPRLNYEEDTEDGIVASDTDLQELVGNYFALREDTMNGDIDASELSQAISAVVDEASVQQQEIDRAEGIENLALYHRVFVQDWTNHIYIENKK